MRPISPNRRLHHRRSQPGHRRKEKAVLQPVSQQGRSTRRGYSRPTRGIAEAESRASLPCSPHSDRRDRSDGDEIPDPPVAITPVQFRQLLARAHAIQVDDLGPSEPCSLCAPVREDGTNPPLPDLLRGPWATNLATGGPPSTVGGGPSPRWEEWLPAQLSHDVTTVTEHAQIYLDEVHPQLPLFPPQALREQVQAFLRVLGRANPGRHHDPGSIAESEETVPSLDPGGPHDLDVTIILLICSLGAWAQRMRRRDATAIQTIDPTCLEDRGDNSDPSAGYDRPIATLLRTYGSQGGTHAAATRLLIGLKLAQQGAYSEAAHLYQNAMESLPGDGGRLGRLVLSLMSPLAADTAGRERLEPHSGGRVYWSPDDRGSNVRDDEVVSHMSTLEQAWTSTRDLPATALFEQCRRRAGMVERWWARAHSPGRFGEVSPDGRRRRRLALWRLKCAAYAPALQMVAMGQDVAAQSGELLPQPLDILTMLCRYVTAAGICVRLLRKEKTTFSAHPLRTARAYVGIFRSMVIAFSLRVIGASRDDVWDWWNILEEFWSHYPHLGPTLEALWPRVLLWRDLDLDVAVNDDQDEVGVDPPGAAGDWRVKPWAPLRGEMAASNLTDRRLRASSDGLALLPSHGGDLFRLFTATEAYKTPV